MNFENTSEVLQELVQQGIPSVSDFGCRGFLIPALHLHILLKILYYKNFHIYYMYNIYEKYQKYILRILK